MITKIHAIYRNGVFLPAGPVPMAEGAEVELTLTSDAPTQSIAEALGEIASLPPQGPQDGFSGADHDHILYGERKAK